MLRSVPRRTDRSRESTATENTEDTEVEEKDELTEQIIGAAVEVHRIRGPSLLESISEEALAVERVSL
jgi:hypothetical protein